MRLDFEPAATLYPITDTLTQNGSHHNEASDLLDEGVKAARAGERLRARAALLQAVDLDPRLENGWLWLASISETPEELLGFLAAADADLVVSGAYGHSRLREWAFGGVTRSLLDTAKFNRFLSS